MYKAPFSKLHPLLLLARNHQRSSLAAGYTLMELVVVMVMIGILSGLAINSGQWNENSLKYSQDRLQNAVKTARTRAITTTSTYRINADPNNPNEAIQVQKIRSGSCQANATLRQASLATDTTIALNSVNGFSIGDRVSVGGTQADVLSVNFGDNTLTLGGAVGAKAVGTKVETVKNWRNDGVFLAEDLNINKKSAKTDPDVRLTGRFGGTTVTGWSICINSRGLVTLFNADGVVNSNLELVLTNTRTNQEARVTIAPGGAMGN